MSKCRVPQAAELRKDVGGLNAALCRETDAVAVIVGTSFLDAALGALLQSHMARSQVTKDLLAPSGALGTFHARTATAYSLGLIHKSCLQALRAVGEIRNMFAHSRLELSFDQPEMEGLCDRIPRRWKVVDQAGAEVPDDDRPLLLRAHGKARDRFTATILMLSQEILMRAELKEYKTRQTSSA